VGLSAHTLKAYKRHKLHVYLQVGLVRICTLYTNELGHRMQAGWKGRQLLESKRLMNEL